MRQVQVRDGDEDEGLEGGGMTYELFDKFTVKDEPIYLANEKVEDIPYDRLADRTNALNVVEARLHSIYELMSNCRVILDDEQKDVKSLYVASIIGGDYFDVDKDYNVDRYALRTLMCVYWGTYRELDKLVRDLTYYVRDLRNETKCRDSRNISATMKYHHVEGDYLLYDYAYPEEEE